MIKGGNANCVTYLNPLNGEMQEYKLKSSKCGGTKWRKLVLLFFSPAYHHICGIETQTEDTFYQFYPEYHIAN